jgi:hypothetical protein
MVFKKQNDAETRKTILDVGAMPIVLGGTTPSPFLSSAPMRGFRGLRSSGWMRISAGAAN